MSWAAFASSTKGAHSTVFAAASPTVRSNAEEYGGMYLNADMTIGKLPNPSADCYDEDLAKELWGTTETILTELSVWEGDNLAE